MYTLLGCIKHKCRDSYVLYIPTVHTFGLALLAHTLLVQTHTHDVSAPCSQMLRVSFVYISPKNAVHIIYKTSSLFLACIYISGLSTKDENVKTT